MANLFSLSMLNPVPFYKKDRALIPQYNTKFNDDWFDRESRVAWLSYGRYYQKWQTNDIIFLQAISDVAPIALKVFTCDGILKATLNFTQVRPNRYNAATFIYEASYSLAALVPGRYRLEIWVGAGMALTKLESDYIDVAVKWPNTVLMEYTNSFFWGDAIFATGWAPSFRIEGWFKDNPPGSVDSTYRDQSQNQTMNFSDPFKTRKFLIGPSSGVPAWTPDLMIWILGCDELFGDGKAFAKADGAKMEDETFPNHPFNGFSIDLQDAKRKTSRNFSVDGTLIGKKVLVAMNVETEGFADTTTGASSNVIEIISTE